jgi:hypothetical protein
MAFQLDTELCSCGAKADQDFVCSCVASDKLKSDSIMGLRLLQAMPWKSIDHLLFIAPPAPPAMSSLQL